MAGRVLAVAQQKGGAGKTTLLAHLAVAFLGRGRSVALLDADPQGSLTLWARQREANLGGDLTVISGEGLDLTREAARLKRAHDLVLIDSPPHAETEARLALRASDLVLVPLQPSPLDLWATRPTLELASAEKREARVVLNRAPARGRLLEATRAALAREAAPLIEAPLGNRSAFAMAMAAGLGVTESAPRGLAADEVRALATALKPWIGQP